MRSSSIKSLVSTITIVAMLALAAPVAEARVSKSREPRTSRSDTVISGLIKLLKRAGRMATNGGPSIPLGDRGNDGGEGDGATSGNGTGTTNNETGQ